MTDNPAHTDNAADFRLRLINSLLLASSEDQQLQQLSQRWLAELDGASDTEITLKQIAESAKTWEATTGDQAACMLFTNPEALLWLGRISALLQSVNAGVEVVAAPDAPFMCIIRRGDQLNLQLCAVKAGMPTTSLQALTVEQVREQLTRQSMDRWPSAVLRAVRAGVDALIDGVVTSFTLQTTGDPTDEVLVEKKADTLVVTMPVGMLRS